MPDVAGTWKLIITYYLYLDGSYKTYAGPRTITQTTGSTTATSGTYTVNFSIPLPSSIFTPSSYNDTYSESSPVYVNFTATNNTSSSAIADRIKVTYEWYNKISYYNASNWTTSSGNYHSGGSKDYKATSLNQTFEDSAYDRCTSSTSFSSWKNRPNVILPSPYSSYTPPTGYSFSKWKNYGDGGNSSLTGNTYSAGTNINTSISYTYNETKKEIWFYPVLTANTYTVKLDKDGGTGGTSSVTATYDSAMPSITIPTRTGHTFGGYYTEKNGGGKQYYTSTGTSANKWDKAENNVTLYAKWTINSYNLTANPNGGTIGTTLPTGWVISGTNAVIKLEYNKAYGTLPTATKAGYVFVGWFTEATGGTAVTSATKMGSANTTIYAHWDEGVIVTFRCNGGEINETNKYWNDSYGEWRFDKVMKVGSTDNNTTTVPTKLLPNGQYAVFKGWYTLGAQANATKIYSGRLTAKAIPGTNYWDSNLTWKGQSNVSFRAYWENNPSSVYKTDWKSIHDAYVYKGGKWRQVKEMYVYKNGEWKLVNIDNLLT